MNAFGLLDMMLFDATSTRWPNDQSSSVAFSRVFGWSRWYFRLGNPWCMQAELRTPVVTVGCRHELEGTHYSMTVPVTKGAVSSVALRVASGDNRPLRSVGLVLSDAHGIGMGASFVDQAVGVVAVCKQVDAEAACVFGTKGGASFYTPLVGSGWTCSMGCTWQFAKVQDWMVNLVNHRMTSRISLSPNSMSMSTTTQRLTLESHLGWKLTTYGLGVTLRLSDTSRCAVSLNRQGSTDPWRWSIKIDF